MLVVKPSSLGDVVHTLPAVHLLKKRYPDTEFVWAVNPEFAPVLEGNPDLAGVLPFPRGRFRGAAGLWRFRAWLRELKRGTLEMFPVSPDGLKAPGTPAGTFDAALDFQGLLRSGLISKASGAPRRIGLSDSREGSRFFHTNVVPVRREAHAARRYLAMAEALDAGTGDDALDFPLPEGSRPAALPAGELPSDAVLLHPFSRGKGKSLTGAQTAELCRLLAPRPVWLAGRSEERPPELPGNVVNLLNATTLPELVWLLRRARAVVSVDSGPMHIAAALTRNVLSLHTWSDPRRVGPWRADAWVWKAGTIMRTDALDAAACAREEPLTDAALPEIAAWVEERLKP